MTTFFELLNTINYNDRYNSTDRMYEKVGGCKRQCLVKPTTTTTTTTPKSDKSDKRVNNNITPEMDVTLYDDKLVLNVELAGVSKDNIEIFIKDSTLTIQGEKKKRTITPKSNNTINNDEDKPSIEEYEENTSNTTTTTKTTTHTTNTTTKSINNNNNNKESNKIISERSFGFFKRNLDLTKILHQLDLDSITTKFEDGLLTIEINKRSNHSDKIKISIN